MTVLEEFMNIFMLSLIQYLEWKEKYPGLQKTGFGYDSCDLSNDNTYFSVFRT